MVENAGFCKLVIDIVQFSTFSSSHHHSYTLYNNTQTRSTFLLILNIFFFSSQLVCEIFKSRHSCLHALSVTVIACYLHAQSCCRNFLFHDSHFS